MTLEQANELVKACASRMDTAYRGVVFDDWWIVSVKDRQGELVSYTGPRREDFQKNFADDIKELRGELLGNAHSVGDFEFARHGVGTKIEAFIVVGQGLFLICNHTGLSMNEIAKNPLWLGAQIPFAELSERFGADRLVLAV